MFLVFVRQLLIALWCIGNLVAAVKMMPRDGDNDNNMDTDTIRSVKQVRQRLLQPYPEKPQRALKKNGKKGKRGKPGRGKGSHCDCKYCTNDVWDTDIEGFTCGDRIDFLQTPDGGNLSEEEACDLIATFFFPCAVCNPKCKDPSYYEYYDFYDYYEPDYYEPGPSTKDKGKRHN